MYTYKWFTFHVVQCVPQHFEHTHVDGVAEGFVIEADSRIRLYDKQTKKEKRKKIIDSSLNYLFPIFLHKQRSFIHLCKFRHCGVQSFQKGVGDEIFHL